MDKELKLNPKQEKFCELYSGDEEFFGNGVQSYIEVYNPDTSKPNWYKTACSRASELLSNPKVFNRINELLEEKGLNDAFVDKQLLFVINQHADFKSKVAAIREYNQLKQRIQKKIDKVDPEGNRSTEYENLTDEQLDYELNKRSKNPSPKTS
jgi:hypothetical protein